MRLRPLESCRKVLGDDVLRALHIAVDVEARDGEKSTGNKVFWIVVIIGY